MIYFLQAADGGSVKIGHTTRLEARWKALEWHYRRPLVLLATMDGGRKREIEIHEQFAHLRLGRTEQFRPGADLMDFIGRPLLAVADPDAIEAIDVPSRANVRSIRLDLLPADHRRLRLCAAKADMSMAAYARMTLENLLIAEANKRGIPIP